MNVNRIQVMIFKKLSKEKEIDVDDYVKRYSMDFICMQRDRL